MTDVAAEVEAAEPAETMAAYKGTNILRVLPVLPPGSSPDAFGRSRHLHIQSSLASSLAVLISCLRRDIFFSHGKRCLLNGASS